MTPPVVQDARHVPGRSPPTTSGLVVSAVTVTADLIAIAVAPAAPSARCPTCGHRSDRVHARYTRTLADLAAGSRRVALVVAVRKFRCTHAGCTRHLFCERLTGVADAHARTTARLADLHRVLGFALGGQPGARVADELGVPTSADTLILASGMRQAAKRVRQHETPEHSDPKGDAH